MQALRLTLRALIPALTLFTLLPSARANDAYRYQVMGQVGQSSLTALSDRVSINDMGEVAFIGTTASGNAIFFSDGMAAPRVISFSPSSTRDYGTIAQLNNLRQVVAR